MKVLVTRPRPGAARTADRLRALGHEAIEAPLAVVAPTGEPPPGGTPDALVVTSAQAVSFLAGLARDRPVHAVGERTAEALREAGFTDVRTGPGDAAGLARLVAGSMAPGARLLHVAGRDRKPEPAATLEAAGFRLATWTAYEARPVDRLPAAAREALFGHTLDTILHFSRRTATLLLGLSEAEGLRPALDGIRHLCLSADVAAPLESAGLSPEVARHPDEGALLALLGAREPGRP